MIGRLSGPAYFRVVCHARFGPRLISVRPDQKRLPEIVRPDNFRCSILSHVTFFGPTLVLSFGRC